MKKVIYALRSIASIREKRISLSKIGLAIGKEIEGDLNSND